MSKVKLETSIMKGVVTEFGQEGGRADQIKTDPSLVKR